MNICEINYFQPNYRLVGVTYVFYNWIHSKVFFEYFPKKIQGCFSERKRKAIEKKASLTGIFNDTCLIPVLNISDKENSLNPKRNSKVSLKYFSFLELLTTLLTF